MSQLTARNDAVIIRIVPVDKTESGIIMPQKSMEGNKFIVVSVGPKVENLKVGDRVLAVGRREEGEWSPIPGFSDLLVTWEKFVVIVYNEEK